MKIDTRTLPEGKAISICEAEDARALDLDVPGVKATSPLEIKADIIKIKDTLDVKIKVKTKVSTQCSKCLLDVECFIERDLRLDYSLEKQEKILDINDDIRQEIILGYPLRPLCKPSCKGLCLGCGSNLNEGECKCKIA